MKVLVQGIQYMRKKQVFYLKEKTKQMKNGGIDFFKLLILKSLKS